MIIEKSMCTGCSACSAVCPRQCIAMVSDNEGFLQPEIDVNKCINCGLCQKTCPVIHKINIGNSPVAYAVQNKNEDVRANSSSGGVFTLLAEKVIEKGGVVYGAAFDENLNVVHIKVDDVGDLYKLRGSKYVQSNVGNSYKEVEQYLKENRLVYFSGTPCQVSGLLSFLSKDYGNLVTQDIICHGVPSPEIWHKYLQYQANKTSSRPVSVSFRKKKPNVSNFFISVDFEDGSNYESFPENDLMMKAFLRNLCLRNSCYNCAFKTKIRPSDFTLADYWGIQNIHPELDDKKGTSLVFVNSSKGAELFQTVVHNTVCVKTDIDKALSFNFPAIKSVLKPSTRNQFMSTISSDNFEETVKAFCKDSFLVNVKKYVKRLIKK